MSKRSLILILLFVLVALISFNSALAQTYGPDVTTTTAAFTCGDAAGTPANVFDNSTGTTWTSSQIGTGVAGGACVGQHFSGTYDIRQITLQQGTNQNNRVASVYWQYSDDGSTYHTIATISLVNDSSVHTYSDLSIVGLHTYWRVLAASNTYDGASRWVNVEMEMMEAVGNPTGTPETTNTLTPTITPTASTTPSPTPNYFVEITSTLGAPMRFERSATYGDAISFGGSLLIAAVMLISVIFVYWKRPGT